MVRKHLRRVVAGIVVAVVIVGAGAVVAAGRWLDPGHKNDRSSDLITPTLSAEASARLFDVSPDELQVEFTATVRGIPLQGVFPVEEGTITLEPAQDKLRVLVRLNINVDAVKTSNPGIDRILRASMETGDYPIAFYVATSRDLVPVTEDVVAFTLDGDLEVHNVPHAHAMEVTAQLVGGHMWAIATSNLDLEQHGVTFPAMIGSATIELTARLQAYEVTDGPAADAASTPPAG